MHPVKLDNTLQAQRSFPRQRDYLPPPRPRRLLVAAYVGY